MSDRPSIRITTAAGATDAVTMSLSGTASGLNFGQVEVYDDGIYVGPAGVYGGSWSLTVAPHQGDNSYTATGYAGSDPGVSSAPAVLTDVQTQPTVTVDQTGGNTDVAVQSLSGTASTAGYGTRFTAGTILTLSDDGAVVGHATVSTDGTWKATVALSSQGINAITVADTDTIGNSGQAVTLFGLKTTVPTVAIASPGGTVDRAMQVISGTATAGDVGDVVTLSEDGSAIGGTAVGIDGSWSVTTTLSAGQHSFRATDADLYGNVGTSGTVSYTLDTTPPAVSIASAGGPTGQANTAVSGRATANSAVTLYDNGAAVGTTNAGADGSWALGLALSQGVNVITASAMNAAGSRAYAGAIVDTLDTTPPAVAFGAVPQTTGTVVTLAGTAWDAGGVAAVEIYQGATALGAAQVAGDGTWTFTDDLGQGTYDQLTAVATDAAGNSAAAAADFDLLTGVTGRRYIAKTTATDATGAVTSVTTTARDGSIGSQTLSNGDGTATSTGYEDRQALFSIGNDVMTGNGQRDNFVFGPAMGHAVVTDFVMGGSGHDTITLSHGDFDSIAQVLHSTTMDHGSAVIDVSTDDTIRLVGVTKAQLIGHKADIAFTA